MASLPSYDPTTTIAAELGLAARGVRAVVAMVGEGATVPFVARYRKEATGGLDEVQIRNICERREYLVALEDRRGKVLDEIATQGKLDAALRARIEAASSKTELEDLYAPFKPKRRTRATIARERGLQQLAELIWAQRPGGAPLLDADAFVDPSREVADVEAALTGARDICAERVSDSADVRKLVRDAFAARATIDVRKKKQHRELRTKFDDYDGYDEPARGLPSHRYLAIQRGEAEGVLRVRVQLDGERLTERVASMVGLKPASPWASQLQLAVAEAYKRLLAPRAAERLRAELKEAADREAVEVFARNLRELLVAAPFGDKPLLGIDPGQRTGCKCAALDRTGKLLAHDTIYLVKGDAALSRAADTLLGMCRDNGVAAVAVGNGTHGRETLAFALDLLRENGLSNVLCISVSEAGASVYSASEVAREELGEVDLTVRGAVSIGRRLQDPLAELVKIDPKSIGVGQYQHDVHQPSLSAKLNEVVEDCVNGVGVELNTASVSLLARVAGLGPTTAKRVVAHRDEKGAFKSRRALLKVAGIGPKTYEQAAGFLRIRGAANPLDSSAVHPERYALVERMARDLGVPVASLVGDEKAAARIDRSRYLDGEVGDFTLDDIIAELRKPGRDPRASFEAPKFRDDVRELEDLAEGMELEGVVTNVTAFGAFVDIGVHQDGLVHVSQLADHFVKSPSDVVKVGDKLRVRVLQVDLQRRRISLSARKRGADDDRPRSRGQSTGRDRPARPVKTPRAAPKKEQGDFSNKPFARRFRK